jgi:hypothetical protein
VFEIFKYLNRNCLKMDDTIIEEIVKTLLEELIGKIEFQLDGILIQL